MKECNYILNIECILGFLWIKTWRHFYYISLCIFYRMKIYFTYSSCWCNRTPLLKHLQCMTYSSHGFHPWLGKMPWRRAWKSTPVFLLGKSQGQGSMMGYSSKGHKESDMTKPLSTYAHTGLWLMVTSFWWVKIIIWSWNGILLNFHYGS